MKLTLKLIFILIFLNLLIVSSFLLYTHVYKRINNEIIYLNDKPVGFIKRSSFSYTMNKALGFGYINYNNEIITDELLDNAKFEIKILGQKYPCNFEPKPFDYKNNRIKGIY